MGGSSDGFRGEILRCSIVTNSLNHGNNRAKEMYHFPLSLLMALPTMLLDVTPTNKRNLKTNLQYETCEYYISETSCVFWTKLFQLMQEYDTDFPKTVGTSHGIKKLNRFNNITVCKCSLDYDNNSLLQLLMPFTR